MRRDYGYRRELSRAGRVQKDQWKKDALMAFACIVLFVLTYVLAATQ